MYDDILEGMSPQLRKLLKKGSDFHIRKQKTPSLTLNKALGGGLAFGRQILIWGSKSAGKSTFCLQMIGMAQKDGLTCAWIDSENSFDPAWAAKLGVDVDQLIVSSGHKVNDIVDVGQNLLKAKVDILVIDSISAAMPAVFFEKDGALKDLSDTKQMGSDARDWANAIKMLNYANEDTLIVLISQQRKALGSMYVKNIPTGGEAVKFFSSTIINLFSSESDNQAIKEKVTIGNKTIERNIGRKVVWDIEANKLGPAFQSGEYKLIFKGDNVGVDFIDELVTLAEEAGILIKAGSWYSIYEHRLQGRDSVVQFVRDNNDIKEKLESELFDL